MLWNNFAPEESRHVGVYDEVHETLTNKDMSTHLAIPRRIYWHKGGPENPALFRKATKTGWRYFIRHEYIRTL